MSNILEKIEAQRQVNVRGCPRHLIGPNELGYLYEMEAFVYRMKQTGSVMASLLPSTEVAFEWARIMKKYEGYDEKE